MLYHFRHLITIYLLMMLILVNILLKCSKCIKLFNPSHSYDYTYFFLLYLFVEVENEAQRG